MGRKRDDAAGRERTPLEALARAALDYRRWVLGEMFQPMGGGMGPSPKPEYVNEAWTAFSKSSEVLHHVVLAIHGFRGCEAPARGTLALAIDGAVVTVDFDIDGLEDGGIVHVVEPADIVDVR